MTKWIDDVAREIHELNPDYREFEAEVAKLIRAALPTWQPIETAPDGVWLLTVWDGDVCFGRRYGASWRTEDDDRIVDADTPTAWMPIPDRPEPA